jgi:hypothetical protein
MSDEAPNLDLGDGVVLETPASDPNKIFNSNDLTPKHKGWPKGKSRKPQPQIAPRQLLNKPQEGESVEHSLIRRLLNAAKARTQLATIIPDQCTGCVNQHKMGIRRMPVCDCVCHQARAWLADPKNK